MNKNELVASVSDASGLSKVDAAKAVDEVGSSIHLSCFDLYPEVMDLINSGKVQYTIDQQQRLQGYMPIIVLHLYNQNAGLLPGDNIPSGPGFVDKSNASSVASQAGINR
jgi:simple sugar transport system substrate-binding protein